MKSLLVALVAHMLADPTGMAGATMAFYVVPAKPFGTLTHGEPLALVTTPELGEPELAKWDEVRRVVGSQQRMAELCYRAAYADILQGLAGMPVADAERFIVESGGYHVLARASVRVCNASLRKVEGLPTFINLRHREFAAGERSLRERAYRDDIAFITSCTSAVCAQAPERFARGVVGVPLEAER